ncbi:MAG: GIY-YIG nuclease family protein [Gammaproteobacteria bacterium]|nr:GIY-YIG nuclease family protein [Gammaproteobacteria bacterium]
MSQWQVYMLRCRGGELYTGIATDVTRRLEEHASGRGAKALRGKGPLSLLISAPVGNRSQAQRVEARIKRLPKNAKEALVELPAPLHNLIVLVLQETDTAVGAAGIEAN